ncbi:hypothetical protein JRI60_12390 [Archangium violaceum]|uniref:hypothetical protein n=1 Tax=Archangium violaceum TaxID=83451 RepID=UPI00194E03C7|nr:hypothetical protein [Archangium violaceum]QRN99760.1 hypothetical protein JRI60_12390 [Archangium violaceum]
MTLRTLALATVAAASLSCVKQLAPPPSGPSRPYPLLKETEERETSALTVKREDVEIDTRDFERTPRVVATGETPVLQLSGARARLYGDAEGTKGFEVDNFILLEVVDASGKVLNRSAVGFTENVHMGREVVDSVGPRSFHFEPGQVDLTTQLPESGPFQVRATVLDYSGVGRVTDVFLVLEPGGARQEDDLRGQ